MVATATTNNGQNSTMHALYKPEDTKSDINKYRKFDFVVKTYVQKYLKLSKYNCNSQFYKSALPFMGFNNFYCLNKHDRLELNFKRYAIVVSQLYLKAHFKLSGLNCSCVRFDCALWLTYCCLMLYVMSGFDDSICRNIYKRDYGI